MQPTMKSFDSVTSAAGTGSGHPSVLRGCLLSTLPSALGFGKDCALRSYVGLAAS